MKIKTIGRLALAILIAELAGVIGSVFTFAAIPSWYSTIIRPTMAPPNWIFGPVWIILYALMGVAAFLVWQKSPHHKNVRSALGLFVVQLALNAMWSVIFFGLQNPGAAFVEIILLWIAIVATMVAFYRVSKPASYLLVPYIAWVTFAAYLNYAIWSLN